MLEMNKLIIFALGATVSAVGIAPFLPAVDLQPSTPGVAQTGHLNISGTATAGVLRAGTVFGNSTALTGTAYGGDFRSASTSGRGFYALASATTGTTYGGFFQNQSIGGRAVYGTATAAAGTTYGGYFQVASTAGRGVFAAATATSGTTYGGRFDNYSPSGRGVFGYSAASSGTPSGVFGQAISPNGYGVIGWASTTTGANFGVLGQSDSSTGTGVKGYATGSDGYAGKFISENYVGLSAHGRTWGITAQPDNTTGVGYGVQGWAPAGNASNCYGLWGYHNPQTGPGYGVYASGNLGASGNKSFRIDHPLDPENKFLLHYSAEGPDVLNIYTGNVRTDARGFAVVKLPSYFESINRDPRYTLTVVDDSEDFVLAKVVKKVQGNAFTIRTSKPNVEVSWEVKGIRNDLHNRIVGAPVVQNKLAEERGKYERPELFGYGRDKAIDQPPVDPDDAKQIQEPPAKK